MPRSSPKTNLVNLDLIESTCRYHLRHLVRDEVVGKRLHASLKWHVKSRACEPQLAGLQCRGAIAPWLQAP